MLLVAEPSLGVDEKLALAEVIDSGWITMGDRVREFERAFAAAHQAVDAVAVSSCTAGLHLAIEGLGLGPGDEILVPSLTFAATVNCVIYAGATPVFVDIESLDTPHISLGDAAAKCTVKTKAVIVMHYAGYPVDREAWREFADSRGLFLIEDCAHAAGARNGGAHGDVAVFSFYGNKNMTTAEGGMVFARDPGVRDRIRQMRGHGMTSGTFERRLSGEVTYDITLLGYNYRMDELRAAIGLVQIRNLGRWNERRRALTRAYRRHLAAQCSSVSMPFSGPRDSVHHILPVILPEGASRQHISEKLRAAGIQTTVHYPPVHRFSWYRSRFPSTRLPATEEFASRELTLPLHPKLEEREVEFVVRALSNALAPETRHDDVLCPSTSPAVST
jgi:dTDP-4-amino-4,6-dideoxygalactose transaminase